MTDPAEIRRAVLAWPQYRDDETIAALDNLIADAARFRKLSDLVDSVMNHGVVTLTRLHDGSYVVRRVQLPMIEDNTFGATLSEAIDNQPLKG